jgi:hypothetical protein
MAREVGIKVKVDGSASAVGIRSIEDNMKRAAEAMKNAIKSSLGSAFDWTKTKWAGAKEALEKPIKEGVKAGKAAFAGLFSDIGGMVSTVGGLVGGLGVAELAKGAIEGKAKWGDLRFGIQAAGGTARVGAGLDESRRRLPSDPRRDRLDRVRAGVDRHRLAGRPRRPQVARGHGRGDRHAQRKIRHHR